MSKMSAIHTFNQWALEGKDEKMKANHFPSYLCMKDIIQERFSTKEGLVVADIGCGNGWATKDLLSMPGISQAYGYDGAETMVGIAQENPSGAIFAQADLNNWSPGRQFDIIYSMEFLYYLNNPLQVLSNIHDKWLKPGSLFIAGIDHYQENKPSLLWEQNLNVAMYTRSAQEWEDMMGDCNFINTHQVQVNQKDDWAGTLIFWGTKK